MSFLRSSLFIAIVSLFVLTGYADNVFGDCCDHEEALQTPTGKTTPGESDNCQCLCHQVVFHSPVEPVRVPVGAPVTAEFVTRADGFPPDAVPLGIDHPPQLA